MIEEMKDMEKHRLHATTMHEMSMNKYKARMAKKNGNVPSWKKRLIKKLKG